MYCEHCNGKGDEHSLTCPNRYKPTKEPYDECPCGIHRGDCYIHKRPKADPYEWGAYDATPLVINLTGDCVIEGYRCPVAHLIWHNGQWHKYNPGDIK